MANNIQKTVKRTVKKDVKKTVKNNKLGAILVVLAFIAFALIGFFSYSAITKNDGLTLQDINKETNISLNQEYIEKGAKFVFLGKDSSDLIKIEIVDESGETVEKPDTSIVSEYFVIYSVDTDRANGFLDKLFISKYKGFKQVRRIIVAE